VDGSYVTVQGLTIRNGLAFELEVNGGAHHLVRCNHFAETVGFVSRSDQMKIDGHATDVHIEHNEFTKWRSQAIDITNADHVFVEENDFHDPTDFGCGMGGGKYGARDITFRKNTLHDLRGPECKQPLTFATGGGGTGSPHPDSYEAENIHIVENRIWNVDAKLAQFVSCKDCSFERNDVWNVAAGIDVLVYANGLPECSASATGCMTTTGLVIAGNRMRALDGRGDPAQANVFFFVEANAGTFTSGTNTYCAAAASDPRFGWQGTLLDFAAWTAASGTDGTSMPLATSDPRCTAF
jgi:hypothetical protein